MTDALKDKLTAAVRDSLDGELDASAAMVVFHLMELALFIAKASDFDPLDILASNMAGFAPDEDTALAKVREAFSHVARETAAESMRS